MDAAQANNISAIYLVSHALLETGNGTSVLANGGLRDSNNNPVFGVLVYNMYGVGAVDSNPNYCGTKYAYDNKWFTPEQAIIGGANFIASQYINKGQDTLYKMRWNPANPASHQYATDIRWAYSQVANIKKLLNMCKNPELVFEFPKYN